MTEMLEFQYKAHTPGGKIARGKISAANAHAAAQSLKQQHYQPFDIRPVKSGLSAELQLPIWGQGLSLKFYAEFCRALADLLPVGIPISDALGICIDRQETTQQAAYVRRLLAQVRGGATLSTALKATTPSAPDLLIAVVSSAEAGGDLPQAFSQLADTFEDQVAFRQETVAQLTYPLALLVLVALTLMFISFFVLPQFEGVFSTSQSEPPTLTAIVLFVGNLIRSYWWLGLGVSGGAALIAWRMIQANKRAVDQIVLNMPLLKQAVLNIEAARFCRTLGTLLHNATPMSRAFPLALQTIANQVLKEQLTQAEHAIRNGTSFLRAVQTSTSLPHTALSFAEIGERTGQLGPMLIRAADLCEADFKRRQIAVTAILGPSLILLMGLIVAAVVGAVMIGILSLNEAVMT